jgi:hypothetical protein
MHRMVLALVNLVNLVQLINFSKRLIDGQATTP